jgi:starvation-inducible outer membrane lipoprotein
MTTNSRSVTRNAAVAVCAATFALGLAACGSAPTVAGTTGTTPAPAITKVDAPTAPHAFSHEARCFPGKRCQ